MNEIQWAPGFIQLTSRTGAKYRQCVAEIVQFSSGTRGDRHGSNVILRGEDEGDRFTLETPEEIAGLIRQEWEHRINREAEIRWASTRGERL
jgi:hypothetical protein